MYSTAVEGGLSEWPGPVKVDTDCERVMCSRCDGRGTKNGECDLVRTRVAVPGIAPSRLIQ